MTDAVYGRPVGLNMFNAVKTAVNSLKESLGVQYKELARECKYMDMEEALWFRLIEYSAEEMCNVLPRNWTLKMLAADVTVYLHRAVGDLETYMFKRYAHSAEAFDKEAILARMLNLKGLLLSAIEQCLRLVRDYGAYCVRMDDYKGIFPRKTWAKCDLCIYLKTSGITEKDATQICKMLGASEVGDLAHVEHRDLLRPSIPAAAIPALLTLVRSAFIPSQQPPAEGTFFVVPQRARLPALLQQLQALSTPRREAAPLPRFHSPSSSA